MRISDWSSDVCSSDLAEYLAALDRQIDAVDRLDRTVALDRAAHFNGVVCQAIRSSRRVRAASVGADRRCSVRATAEIAAPPDAGLQGRTVEQQLHRRQPPYQAIDHVVRFIRCIAMAEIGRAHV